MQVYRAEPGEAMRLFRKLSELGVPAQVERYGSTNYVVVNTARPDIPEFARAAGQTVRRVHTLDQLAAQPGD